MSDAYRSIWTDLAGYAFDQGYVDAGGIKTRYLHAGTPGNPVLLMLHGTGSHAEIFSANLGPHSAHFDCYAFDFVGNGRSDKPDRDLEIADYVDHVRAFMDANNIRRAHLLGVSLGSWVAARFALSHADRAAKFTMVAPSGKVSDPERMKRLKATRGGSAADPSWTNIRTMMDRLVHDKTAMFDDMVGCRQQIYRLPGMKEAMPRALALQEPDIRERNLISDADWQRIAAPALVIGALNDHDADFSDAKDIAGLIPGSRLVTMAGVGHWPHLERPAEFNPLNIEFLLGG